MKLVTYKLGEGAPRLGALVRHCVVDVSFTVDRLKQGWAPARLDKRPDFVDSAKIVAAAGPVPADMVALLAHEEAWLSALQLVLDRLVASFDPEEVPGVFVLAEAAHLLAPIPRPGKIVCVGRNYAEHARERGREIPTQPIFFLKSNNTICGHGDAIVIPPNSTQVDYEAELAVVIGKGGKQIPEDKAYEHVAGYMVLNDVSARDMQSVDQQWFRGKSCDTFAPTGPWIVTKDEIPDPHSLHISLTLNGQTMQDSNTGNMIFKIPFLISYLSRSMTLEAGDIVATGTPQGVGASRTPPVFLKPGDSVSITIERIGTLTNPVTAA